MEETGKDIWVVIHSDDLSYSNAVDLFSTQDLAQAYCDKHNKWYTDGTFRVSKEPWKVDSDRDTIKVLDIYVCVDDVDDENSYAVVTYTAMDKIGVVELDGSYLGIALEASDDKEMILRTAKEAFKKFKDASLHT